MVVKAAGSNTAKGTDKAAAVTAAANQDRSRRTLDAVLAGLAVFAIASLAAVCIELPKGFKLSLVANLGLSVAGFFVATAAIDNSGPMFIAARLRGIDLNKRTTKRDAQGNLIRPVEGIEIPESMGTVVSAVYILVMSVFIPFAFAVHERHNFPHSDLAEYLAAVLTITFAAFMGFADDVLDLRWRHKIPLPFLATLPLLLVYYANGNETAVMVPQQFRLLFGDYVELGFLFYLFLLCFSVFSCHTINIYAGVNGLEVGQSVVIGVSALALNIIQLYRTPLNYPQYREQHVQSLFLLIPFLAVSIALLRQNWCPSRVFVGDTYCYFAGMTFAAVCIVGHFSKTMVLLMIPQLLNFLYSVPQLFRLVGIPNPRHRMPAYDMERNWVKNSYTEFRPESLNALGKVVFWVLKTFRLAHVLPPDEHGMVKVSNLTLINFVLYVGGPCPEDILCTKLLAVQLAATVLCFTVRFGVASFLFERVL